MELVAYLRVSSDSQVKGSGLETQRKEIRAWARKNKHTIVAELVDAGVSGTLDAVDRPGLAEALDMLRPPPRARGLVVAHLDRLSRSLGVQETVLSTAWKAGATVFAADAGEILRDDPDDPIRTLVRQIVGGVAQFERALIAKRMREGRKNKAARGHHAVGQHAYGKTSGGPQADSIVDPDEQAVVDRIVALRAAGASYRAICAALEAEGHRPRRATSGQWQPMVVRRIAERAGR